MQVQESLTVQVGVWICECFECSSDLCCQEIHVDLGVDPNRMGLDRAHCGEQHESNTIGT